MSGQQEEEPVIEQPAMEHRSSFALGPDAMKDINAIANDDNPFEEDKSDDSFEEQDVIQKMFECRITNLVEFTDKKEQKQEKKQSEILNDIVLYI